MILVFWMLMVVFFFKYLFIYLCQALVAACGIFSCVMQTLRSSAWDLVPWPGTEPRAPALGAQSLSHWTSKEVPWRLSFKPFFPLSSSPSSTGCLCVLRVCSCSAILTLCDPMDCFPPGPSVYGTSPGKDTGVGCHSLLQVVFPPRDQTWVSCVAGGFFTEPGSSLLSAIRVATSACLRLWRFSWKPWFQLQGASSSLAFCVMYPA